MTNVVDATTTVNSMMYTQLASSSLFHTTQIPAGVTLNVNGTGTIAFVVGTETDLGNTAQIQTSFTGGGTLSINEPTGSFYVRQSTATTSTQKATLDLSGLTNFVANVNEFNVGVGSNTSLTGATIGGRATGNLLLATTNTITANTIRVSSNQSGATAVSTLFLGQTNTLNASNILFAERRGVGSVVFNAGVTNGALTIRGMDGISAASVWNIAPNLAANTDNNSAGGTVDLTAGTGRGSGSLDALVSSMVIGRQGLQKFTGKLVYDTGGIRADSIVLGDNNGNNVASSTANAIGSLQVQGTGTLLVTGNMTLGKLTGTTNAIPVGILTLGTTTAAGGDVRVAGDIVDAGGTSSITVNGGNLQARTIGSVASPIDGLNINSGTLTVSVGTGGAPVNVSTLTANGSIRINLNVAGSVPLGQQKLIDYSTIAGTGFAAFSLAPKFPARIQATLVDNPGDSIDLNVTQSDSPKWNGNLSSVWDINATQNWSPINAGGARRLIRKI